MEMVMSSVDRAIQQLGGTPGPTQNSSPGDIQTQGYAMAARTRQDVAQQSPHLLTQPADIPAPNNQQLVQQGLQEESNDMFALLSRSADPAVQQLGQGVPNQPMPQPPQEVQATPSGLILPAGPPPQPIQEVQNERTSPGHSGDSVSWLL